MLNVEAIDVEFSCGFERLKGGIFGRGGLGKVVLNFKGGELCVSWMRQVPFTLVGYAYKICSSDKSPSARNRVHKRMKIRSGDMLQRLQMVMSKELADDQHPYGLYSTRIINSKMGEHQSLAVKLYTNMKQYRGVPIYSRTGG